MQRILLFADRRFSSYIKEQSVPKVNIPGTETIKLVRTYQKKRRRQPIKTNDGHGCTGEEKKGAA